jgi:3-(3-hydroxy-phenyl)propionate hydroxylase
LLHKQPDGVWRIDLQLGWDIDKKEEKKPEKVIPRLKAMLGDDVNFELEWVSIYTFQCRRMEKFRHGRVIFAGDSAHQVSPFGARGANSGLQDVDNLGWKLAAVIKGQAQDALLDTYDIERIHGADENILNSSRSTDFITPKSDTSRIFRDAVLDLSEKYAFARPLVNSGRLSMPCAYDGMPLNGVDAVPDAPARSRPGMPCPDAPYQGEYLLSHLGGTFTLLALNTKCPEDIKIDGFTMSTIGACTKEAAHHALAERYLGDAQQAVYLIRPDQHVVARWPEYDETAVKDAIKTALGENL